MKMGVPTRHTPRVFLLPFVVAVAFSLAPVSASADTAACVPQITDGWVRMPPMAMPMLAGFGTIDNACDAPSTVVSGSSPDFADVSIHETRFEDGMAKMREVPKLVVPAGGSATLKPGGLHMMLMQPHAAPAVGDVIRIDLQLEDGRTIQGDFEVRK